MINSEKVSDRKHVPEPTRLPKCVTGWQEMDLQRLWNDGCQLLVAVPVQNSQRPSDGWYYEFSVIVIKCDEDSFDIETTCGNEWGWELDCIDYFVILSE